MEGYCDGVTVSTIGVDAVVVEAIEELERAWQRTKNRKRKNLEKKKKQTNWDLETIEKFL